MRTLYAFVLALVILVPSHAFAQTPQSVSHFYTRASAGESFFTSATTHGYTTNPYGCPVEAVISGTWYMLRENGGLLATPHHGGFAMTSGFAGYSLVMECGGDDIHNWKVFQEGADPMIPEFTVLTPFNVDHVYHFVIDVGLIPMIPTLRVSDGSTPDNSSGFDITLFQLSPGRR